MTGGGATSGPQAKILLVDDDPANLLALEAVLEGLGQPLVRARSGQEALHRLSEQDFAVVLLDVQMAGLDGFETARRIRAAERSKDTPIIFLTAFDSDAFPPAKAYTLGAVDYLVKPVAPEVLRAKVAAFVDLFHKTERLREAERLAAERRLAEESLRLAEAAGRRLSFLAEAGEILAGSLEHEATLASVARLAVPHIADWCIVDLVEGDGSIRQVAVAHVDPEKVRYAWELDRRYPDNPAAPVGVPEVIRSGRPVLFEEVTDDVVRAVARDAQHLAILRQLGICSGMIVPLAARGRTVGAISLGTAESGRRYGPEDLALAEELARRAALAVDNARLYREARAQEERFRLVAENVRDYAILLLNPTGEVIHWNEGAARILGYQADEVLGQSAARFFTPEDIAAGRPDRELREAVASGRSLNECWLVRKDKSRFWASGVTTALRDERALRGFVKILRDLTERKALEDELRCHAEELAEANRRKDEFLAMLSHELRNPLAPVLTGVAVLRRLPAEEASRTRTLDMVERQARHLARLVDDLLDVSRITRGKIELHCERLDLGRLARLAAEDRRSALEAAGLALAVQTPETPVWVSGDATRLAQVVGNLLDNARKFTKAGGRVSVRLTADATAHEVVLDVLDTGMGFEPTEAARLFEPFAQADRSLERTPGGLGLGLAVVKGLAELHGGRALGSSAGPGRGATFSVRLPLIHEPDALTRLPCAVAPRKPGEPGAHAPRRLRVLVIEDHRDAADSLRVLLEMQGHDVRVAYTGPEGVREATERPPDAVLSDIGLPGLSGLGVAAALRRNPATQGVRLIALTGYGGAEDRRRSQEAGFDAHVVKPVSPEELERLLTGT
jgi:PAS domain S-box-containing protein